MVVVAGVYLTCIGVAAFAAPARVSRFLLGFAGTPATHCLEMTLRGAVGAAFVVYAPFMRMPAVFATVGWVLLFTTAVLLVVPWRWHQRFAQRSVPRALRFLPLLGAASVAMGGFVLFSALAAPPN